MDRKVKEENISALTKDRETFIRYVRKSYEREQDFPNSSFYFHKRVIETIRASKSYKDLLSDKIFLEYVYATLSTWGLDRMDGMARLVEFNIFRKTILDNSSLLSDLSKYRIEEINEIEMSKIKEKISILFDNLKIMLREARLVGVSKALHHLLPDLIMPIDRKYTLDFFYGDTNYNGADQKGKFLEIFDKSCAIAKKLNLNNNDLTGQWDTSIPKLIDNAIIGFISSK